MIVNLRCKSIVLNVALFERHHPVQAAGCHETKNNGGEKSKGECRGLEYLGFCMPKLQNLQGYPPNPTHTAIRPFPRDATGGPRCTHTNHYGSEVPSSVGATSIQFIWIVYQFLLYMFSDQPDSNTWQLFFIYRRHNDILLGLRESKSRAYGTRG